MHDHRSSRGQPDHETDRTIDTATRTAQVFRSVIETARTNGDVALVARLNALALDAEERLEWLRTLHRGAPVAPAPARGARVLLVDDHELSREALRSVLRAEQGFTVVGEAGDGETAVRVA